MKKTWDIGKRVALVTIISVGIAYAGQVRKNTAHRLTQNYFQIRGWVETTERECGKDAKRCSAERQNMVREWKLQVERLGKKIGIK